MRSWMCVFLMACSYVPRASIEPGADRLDVLERRVAELEMAVLVAHAPPVVPAPPPPAPTPAQRVTRCVPGSAVELALTQTDELARMGRALLHRGPDGAFDGYRVSGILAGTLLDELGIANGDIVHQVNGVSLTSVSACLQAYETLTQPEQIEVLLTRRGAPVELTVDLNCGAPVSGG